MEDDEHLNQGGPNITERTMLDYANDQLVYDIVTQQFFDQLLAATDDARSQIGVMPDGVLTLRARETLQAMWDLMIDRSGHNMCEHVATRALQPTAIVEEDHGQLRQLCLPCAQEWTVPKQFSKGGKVECQCCGVIQTVRTETVRMTVLQHWYFVSILFLCPDCERDIAERVEAEPE